MTKRKRYKIYIVIFIFSIIILNINNIFQNKKIEIEEEKNIEQFIKLNNVQNQTKTKKTKGVKKETIDYIAVLEIPKIDLKKGLVKIDSKENNVNQNIEILKTSKMPNENKSNLILASHSGNSKVSFFNQINKLSINDNIYIYYNSKKYKYQVIKIYEKRKEGEVSFSKNPKYNMLFLITCSTKNKNNQLYVIAKLVN